LSFIDSNVIKDYENFVKTGDQYSLDSEYIRGITEEFRTQAEDLCLNSNSQFFR